MFGATNQAGEDNRNVARMAMLLAGLPYEVPAVTVNRLCGSGLEAVSDAVRRVATGDAECVIAGGVESMTRAPFVFGKSDEAFARSAPKVYDTSLGWRFENPQMAERFPLQSMGETAENVAEKWKISREEQDAFALASHEKALQRAGRGRLRRARSSPVSIPQKKGDPVVVAEDESPREDASLAALAKLQPVFRKGGTVTAGNSSPLNDGASALMVVSEEVLKAENLEPLARVVAERDRRRRAELHGRRADPRGQEGARARRLGASATSISSSSTRRSPRRPSRASAASSSTPRASTCAAAPSRSDTRSARAAAASSSRSSTR